MSKLSAIISIRIGMIIALLIVPQFSLSAEPKKNKSCFDPLPVGQRIGLVLTADRKVVTDKKTTFEPIAGKSFVRSGDVIKYTIVARNNSHCPIKNLILKQSIPKRMNYLRDSATVIDGVELLFSVDGGKTFSAKPKIDGQLAPTTAYNYLRWKFTGTLATNAQVKTTYHAEVKPQPKPTDTPTNF
jgi:uncharacterized repeat protein (TIGR01451 family)